MWTDAYSTVSRQQGVRTWAVPRPIVSLAFILAIALVLRILFIDSRGLWSDEAYRVLAARQDTIFDTLRAAWAQPPSAPLYWVALHVWVQLLGHGDVVVRLFSVPASVGTLLVTYRLGRMVGGTAVALVAALLLAGLLYWSG
jgi:4-amino-4-deoxy-L-arabinose transferase-like glycosyltransferase